MLLSFQAFVQRAPFDISEAETELMEGPLMEYSGPKLALLKYTSMAKLVIYSAIFVALFRALGIGAGIPAGLAAVLAEGVRLGAGGDAGRRYPRALSHRPGHPLFCGLLAVALAALGLATLRLLRGELMSLLSKIEETVICLKAGNVTLPYPAEPQPLPEKFRGRPIFDAAKCIGCAGCANNCPARAILVFDVCQEIRILQYLGRRCTYCGRCADVCPEKAITMSHEFENGTDNIGDLRQRLELFMSTCQRCGRCFKDRPCWTN